LFDLDTQSTDEIIANKRNHQSRRGRIWKPPVPSKSPGYATLALHAMSEIVRRSTWRERTLARRRARSPHGARRSTFTGRTDHDRVAQALTAGSAWTFDQLFRAPAVIQAESRSTSAWVSGVVVAGGNGVFAPPTGEARMSREIRSPVR
jgi:hypothetical protein